MQAYIDYVGYVPILLLQDFTLGKMVFQALNFGSTSSRNRFISCMPVIVAYDA